MYLEDWDAPKKHLSPEHLTPAPCLRSGPIFMQPVMQGFDYAAQRNTRRDVENAALQRKGSAIWVWTWGISQQSNTISTVKMTIIRWNWEMGCPWIPYWFLDTSICVVFFSGLVHICPSTNYPTMTFVWAVDFSGLEWLFVPLHAPACVAKLFPCLF